MARLYRKQEKQGEKVEAIEERAQNSADTIAQDVDEVLKEEKSLKTESAQRLNEILEETEDLRQEK